MVDISNPYYDDLFNTFDRYVSTPGDLSRSTLKNYGSIGIPFSSFEPNIETPSGFINMAGNYKYTCIVPLDPPNNDDRPPNYIGVLKENGALDSENLISELLSFSHGNYQIKSSKVNETPIHNVTRLSSQLYDNLYRPPNNRGSRGDSSVRMINFTDGLPYSYYEPSLRLIHRDISKRINRLIDYAIASGQTSEDTEYDSELTNRFLDIFFANSDDINKAIPHYYSLRTGVLPSAISYTKYLNGTLAVDNLADSFKEELEFVKKGAKFMPAGKSDQFFGNTEKKHIYWYPFNVTEPYSYYFNYGDEWSTLDDLKYQKVGGFNHYLLKGDTEIMNNLVNEIVNSVPVDTKQLNEFMINGESRGRSMILSYESSLMDIPGPHNIRVTPMINPIEMDKTGNCLMDGRLSNPIQTIEDWANPIVNGEYSMNPLLNINGKDKYLKITTEKSPVYISNEMSPKKDTDMEEAHYYNYGFKFFSETEPVDRLNYFNAHDENSCDVNSLEFAKISKTLYDFEANEGNLQYSGATVDDRAFGMLSRRDKQPWKHMSIGITKSYKNLKEVLDANLGLFSYTLNDLPAEIPNVNLPIRAILYGSHWSFNREEEWHRFKIVTINEDEESAGTTDRSINFQVPFLLSGGEDGIEIGRNDHEAGTDHSDYTRLLWKDWKELDVNVKFDKDTALAGSYIQRDVYAISKTVMQSSSITDFYYTIHILADDGDGKIGFSVSSSDGMPNFNDTPDTTTGTSNKSSQTHVYGGSGITKTYGTGVQYFFGGVCDKTIYDAYYEKGLTVQQLLDLSSKRIEDGGHSRVVGGIRRANTTFEWDYDLILKAWRLALWIMKDRPSDPRIYTSGLGCTEDIEGCPPLWNTKWAPVALSAFFDYIYQTNKAKLMVGPSLKQINNAIGPYGTNQDEKGGEDDKSQLITLKGAAWNVASSNTTNGDWINVNVANGKYGDVYSNLHGHARAAAHVYADRDIGIYAGGPAMGKNGVGNHYWGKGGKFRAGNGSHHDADPRTTAWGRMRAANKQDGLDNEGYLHLDHYSWNWDMTQSGSPTGGEDWKGVFMIHAEKPGGGIDNDGGSFKWHMAPFHEVSSAAHAHSNAYGVRTNMLHWDKLSTDMYGRAPVSYDNPLTDDDNCRSSNWNDHSLTKQAWDGINGWTNANQNPNIRVRLPMLWRYLKALRIRDNTYTDGQLMPCGVELHYCTARKSLVTSITGTENPVPISRFASETTNAQTWRETICDPGSTVFAEALMDTYAISTATIDKWKNILYDPNNSHKLISNILKLTDKHRDKLATMKRAKTYISALQKDRAIDITKGQTVYNLPILPSISTFGMAVENTDDPAGFPITIGSSMKQIYESPPNITLSPLNVSNIGLGVTERPVLDKGVTENQFTAIARALYTDILNFDSSTFGWLLPLPIRSNIALLNAFDGQWREGLSLVIPLRTQDYSSTLEKINEKNVRWIGWVNSSYLYLLENKNVHTYDTADNDFAEIPMVSLRITPVWNMPESVLDGNEATPSEMNVNDIDPVAVKMELDTRGSGFDNQKMVLISDNHPQTPEFLIHNLTKEVNVEGNKITSFMTIISYDRTITDIPEPVAPSA